MNNLPLSCVTCLRVVKTANNSTWRSSPGHTTAEEILPVYEWKMRLKEAHGLGNLGGVYTYIDLKFSKNK